MLVCGEPRISRKSRRFSVYDGFMTVDLAQERPQALVLGLDARGCFFVNNGEDEIYRMWRFDETGRFEDVEHPPIFERP